MSCKMKILTLSLFVFAMMGVIRAAALSQDEDQPTTEPISTNFHWEPSCPKGWSMYSMQCILYVPKIMTWDEAEENCRSKGGNLATVFQDNPSDDIQKELQKVGHGDGPIWFGGHEIHYFPWSEHFECSENNAESYCLQITVEEDEQSCTDVQCDARLPSVCGIIIM
uniref:C-type lectin domain-containing protein n=1 Tax=Anabas testudineus TaxID=64144 RepID=A0A3Q1ICW0_ANATE